MEIQTVQHGCLVDKLTRFGDVETHYNESNFDSYYIINGFCGYCRNENWDFLATEPNIHQQMEQVEKENNLAYEIIIAHRNLDTREDLLETIESFDNLPIKPKKITIATNLELQESKLLYVALKARLIDINVDIVVSPISEDYDDLLSVGGAKKGKVEYTFMLVSGNKLNDECVQKLDEYNKNSPHRFLLALYDYFYVVNSALLEYYAPQTIDIVDVTIHELKKNKLESRIIDETESMYSNS